MTSNQGPIQLPCTLGRRRVRIRPTRYGYGFIFLLLAMFVGSINYNNNLGFLLTFLLGSMVFVSTIQTYKNLSGLTIQSVRSQPVFAGNQVIFEFKLQSAGKPHHAIGLALNPDHVTRCDMSAKDQIRVHVPVEAVSRGILKTGPLVVFSDYPLGLFRVCAILKMELQCVVYPKPVFAEARFSKAAFAGAPEGDATGPGIDDFQGLRGYTPGDPLHRISWRASARGQGFFVKDFQGNYRASIYLDWRMIAAPDVENKLSKLCHMVLTAHQHNLPYGLNLPDNMIEPGSGVIHRNRCLTALALFSG